MDPTSDALGLTLALAGGAVALVLGAVLRRKLPGAVLVAGLAACGAAVGMGALLLLDADPGRANRAATVVALAVLVPFHVRVVFGPLGKPRAS